MNERTTFKELVREWWMSARESRLLMSGIGIVLLVSLFVGLTFVTGQLGLNKQKSASGDETATSTTEQNPFSAFIGGEGGHDEPQEVPLEIRSQMLDVATKFVTAWARPNVSAAEWFAGVKPYLPEEKWHLYELTLPANVPASRVISPATLVDSGESYVSSQVETDVGTIAVTVSVGTDSISMGAVTPDMMKVTFFDWIDDPNSPENNT